MNKLRELIAKFESVRAISGWREKAIHRDNLEDYLMDNAAGIASLIDEAQKIGLTLRADHPLSVALSKLEE